MDFFTGGVLARIVVCAVATLVGTVLVWILERDHRPHFGMLLALGSSTVVGTMLAIFMGVLSLISEFRAMAMRGGGLVMVAAGMWEGTQPVRFALYAGVVAGLIGVVWVLRQETSDRAETSSGRAVVLMVLFVVVCAVALTSFLLFNGVMETILLVMDPGEHYREIAPATMSQRISQALIRTAFTSVTGFVFTLAAIPIGLAIGRPVFLTPLRQKITLFLLALLTISILTAAFMTTSWSTRLKQIALTGSIPR